MAYLGKTLMPFSHLRRGDVLICDASDLAIESGPTHADALSASLRTGVNVRSVQGLHAKIVVLPERVYIGL